MSITINRAFGPNGEFNLGVSHCPVVGVQVEDVEVLVSRREIARAANEGDFGGASEFCVLHRRQILALSDERLEQIVRREFLADLSWEDQKEIEADWEAAADAEAASFGC